MKVDISVALNTRGEESSTQEVIMGKNRRKETARKTKALER
jgi:hypothetical protein